MSKVLFEIDLEQFEETFLAGVFTTREAVEILERYFGFTLLQAINRVQEWTLDRNSDGKP